MRILVLLTGSILLFLGLISMVTPIPGGVLAITVGCGMIICASETAARCVKQWRTKYNRFHQAVSWLEQKMGGRLGKPLRNTRPDSDHVANKQFW